MRHTLKSGKSDHKEQLKFSSHTSSCGTTLDNSFFSLSFSDQFEEAAVDSKIIDNWMPKCKTDNCRDEVENFFVRFFLFVMSSRCRNRNSFMVFRVNGPNEIPQIFSDNMATHIKTLIDAASVWDDAKKLGWVCNCSNCCRPNTIGWNGSWMNSNPSIRVFFTSNFTLTASGFLLCSEIHSFCMVWPSIVVDFVRSTTFMLQFFFRNLSSCDCRSMRLKQEKVRNWSISVGGRQWVKNVSEKLSATAK